MSTSIAIPEELIEQFERGNVVPLLGPELSQSQNTEKGLPSLSELAQELARRSDYVGDNLAFSRVAQHYEMQKERQALISFLRERLADINAQPTTIHRLLASYPWRFVVTTALDNLFERALSEARHPFTSIIGNIDVAYEDQDKLLLVRMYGSLDQPDTVAVTELDYLRWQGQVENVMDLLKGLIASRTLLILGHDLEDEHLRNLYGWVTLPFKRNVRRSYAITYSASAHTTALWKKLGVEIIPSEPTAFVDKLLKRVHSRRSSPRIRPAQTRLVPLPPIPRQPYKFLNSYEESDSSIFFGRDKEKTQILSKIASFRLVLLHGKSGTGKTSLIKAGLMPDLRERGYSVIYTRILLNPILSIQRALNETLKVPLPNDISLQSFLTRVLTNSRVTHVLFLDQFEELFTEQYDAVIRQEFLVALGEIYADTSLDLKIVIATREDALAELSVLKQQIPEIFYNDYHLELLTAAEARQAIVNPVGPYGIHYEEGLVDQILKDLGGENVDPPQLQIVCDHLYMERGEQDPVISYAQYDHLGGARAILAEYLSNVLNQYPGAKRLILQTVLKEFVTSGARQAIPTLKVLIQHTGLSLSEILQVLDELEEARLIRELPPEPHFELVHEYLIPQISSWTSEEDRAQKRAQEMLEQGLSRWQNFHIPLFADELVIINQQSGKLLLNDESRSFLINSSVWTGSGAEYWLEQATSEQRFQSLQSALEDTAVDRRSRAVLLIGRFSVVELIPRLKQLIEEDSVIEVRRQAISSLVQMDGSNVIPWLRTMLNGMPAQQERSLEIIDQLLETNTLDIVGIEGFSRLELRWRLDRLRLKRNQHRVISFMLYCSWGGALGGILGGYFGTGLFAVVGIGGLIGFVLGLGTGIGHGIATSIREKQNVLIHLAGAVLGGSIGGLLTGIGGLDTPLSLDQKLLIVAVGMGVGIITSTAVAILVDFTASINGLRYRTLLRLGISIPTGAVTTGAMLAVVTGSGLTLTAPGVEGSFLIGLVSFIGIVTGLHLCEQRFATPKIVQDSSNAYIRR